MKALKILIIVILVVILVAVALIVTLLSSSSLQTMLVKKFLPAGVSVQNVAIDLRSVKLTQVKIAKEGTVIEVANCDARLALFKAIFSGRLDIEELKVTGVEVGKNRKRAGPTAEKSVTPPPSIETAKSSESAVDPFERFWKQAESFKGVFRKDISWPPLSIGLLLVEGKLNLPVEGRSAEFKLSGNDIRSSVDPELDFKIDYFDTGGQTPVETLSIDSTITITVSSENNIEGVRLDGNAVVKAGIEGADKTSRELGALLDVRKQIKKDAEEYKAELFIEGDDSQSTKLLTVHAAYSYTADDFSGNWAVEADSTAIPEFAEAFMKGAEAEMSGEGSFRMNPSEKNARTSGAIRMRASKLDNFKPELAPLSSLLVDSSFTINVTNAFLKVESLQARLELLDIPKDKPFISLEAQQPFGFDFSTARPVYGNPEIPLASLSIAGFPVALANAQLSNMDLTLSSCSGEFVLSGTGEKVRLETDEPFQIKAFSLKREGTELLKDLDIGMEASVVYQKDSVTFDLGHIKLMQDREQLLKASANGSVRGFGSEPQLDIQSQWECDLPKLLAQPAALPFRNLTAGRLDCDLSLTGTPADLSVKCDLRGADLKVASNGRVIEKIDIAIDAQRSGANKVQATGPFSMRVDGRSSDIDLDLIVQQKNEAIEVALKGSGKQVVAEDVKLLAEAFKNPDTVSPETARKGTVEVALAGDESGQATGRTTAGQPLWAGVLADLDLKLDSLIVSGANRLSDLVLEASTTEDEVRIETFKARLAESEANAKGTLSFRPEQTRKPYLLQADVSLADFDVGRYLREIASQDKPNFAGKVNIKANVRSESPSVEGLVDSIVGEATLTGEGMIVRALNRGKVGGALGLTGRLGELGGVLSGEKRVEAVGRIATYFDEVEVDELSLKASRSEDRSINIDKIYLRNPDLLIEGQGEIAVETGREFVSQPMRVVLQMAAKPPLSSLFDDIDLLEKEAGESGYRPLKESVEIKGTVGKPDPSFFWKMILKASARKLLDDSKDGSESGDREEDLPIKALKNLLGV